MLRMHERNWYFRKKKKPICDFSRSIKCLKQSRYQTLLLTCAPMSELPSNISTMVHFAMLYSFALTGGNCYKALQWAQRAITTTKTWLHNAQYTLICRGWNLYQMVTLNVWRTHEGKKVFSGEKRPLLRSYMYSVWHLQQMVTLNVWRTCKGNQPNPNCIGGGGGEVFSGFFYHKKIKIIIPAVIPF